MFLPLFILLFSADVFAVPANSTPWTHTQSDGSTITVIRRGDEGFHFYADSDDNLLILADDKDFHYVKRDGDSLSLFASKDKNGGNNLKLSELSDEDIKRKFAAFTGQGTDDVFKDTVPEPVTLDRLKDGEADAEIDSYQGSGETKTMPLVSIVVSFNNIASKEDYVWSDKLYGEGDTLESFYYEMSDHKFTFRPAEESCEIHNGTPGFDEINDGIIHVTLSGNHLDWSDMDGIMSDSFKRMLEEAVIKAGDYMDFSRYDTNGNRAIDNDELGISFIVAGYNPADMIDPAVPADQCMWPHQYDLYKRVDGVRIDSYIAISECVKYEGEAEKQEYPGVIYHELGHYLGLRDLYDTEYLINTRPEAVKWNGYDIYFLSIMYAGNYATDSTGNYKTTGFDAFSRALLGWIEPQEATRNGIYTISSQESSDGYNILLIPTGREYEYYLLENRRAEGIDEGLREYGNYMANGEQNDPNGIVIWHIEKNVYDEYNFDNEVNTADHCPAVMPLFPEGKATGDWQFSEYTLDFNDSLPDYRLPFYNRSNFEKVFKNTEGYENGLFLPLYGEGDDKDDPDKRTLSSINLRFTDDPSRDMKVEISGLPETPEEKKADTPESDRSVSPKAISEILTEEDKALLNDPDASTVSKNELLSAVNRAIDKRVEGISMLSFNSALKVNGKNNGREYWVKMSLNKALRYDGRKHVFSSKKKSSKSGSADINVQVFYCEKSGAYASSPPGDDEKGTSGNDGWTEAKVKKVRIANPKNAAFDFSGEKRKDVKGLSGTTYITGIELEEKELNKTVGKALNSAIKSLARKIKADKSSDYSDGELENSGLTEAQLVIPVYALFIGVDNGAGHYIDGNGNENSYTFTPGTFNAEKGKLKGAKVRFNYSNGTGKNIKLKYSSKKLKDFDTVAEDTGSSDAGAEKRLSGRGNFSGYIEYR